RIRFQNRDVVRTESSKDRYLTERFFDECFPGIDRSSKYDLAIVHFYVGAVGDQTTTEAGGNSRADISADCGVTGEDNIRLHTLDHLFKGLEVSIGCILIQLLIKNQYHFIRTVVGKFLHHILCFAPEYSGCHRSA